MSTEATDPVAAAADAMRRGDELRQAGRIDQALGQYLAAAAAHEVPPAALCLKIARCHEKLANFAEAGRWALAAIDAGDDFSTWQAAAPLVQKHAFAERAPLRSIRLAVLGSYTTTQLVSALRTALARVGVAAEIYEGNYGQYRQDILDGGSAMYGFGPDFVVLAVHQGDLALPQISSDPAKDVAAELDRWTSLWQALGSRSKARLVQHNFALPAENAMGHLASRLPGSRPFMAAQLNLEMGRAAGNTVSIVDCERLSAMLGKQRWFDARYWHISKQAVSLAAVPLLARHTAAVIAADLGLSRKCLVLDLDNTLWGGIIGEDGLAGIKLGNGPDGEAYIAFQEHILRLAQKGVILAVCSKNNDADAREVFEKHPEMRIKLDDIACFVANWQPKPENLRNIARQLNIGLDSLVFVDDNPVERAAVRQMTPEVDVIVLPRDPAQYVAALAGYLMFETSAYTAEDAARAEQYRARAQIAQLQATSASIEDFYRSLQMKAVVAPFNDVDLPRIAQLVGKTNQFNLTTRRHTLEQLRQFAADPACVHLTMRLSDRFADHGLISVAIAFVREDVLDIDTWLMSCRVIGRTVEAEMLKHLCMWAAERGCRVLRGTYIPTAKNGMVAEVYGKYGFTQVAHSAGTTIWEYDLGAKGPINNTFIQNGVAGGFTHERA